MIKTSVGPDVDVEIGLLASGGKTMTWHCWAAATEAHEYSFRVIGDSTGGNWTLGYGVDTSKGALEYDDWDVIVLQPYWLEVQVGYSTGTTTETRPWKNLEDSVPYMLDFAASFCPDAKFYLFFPWVMTQKLELDADIKTYDKVRGFISLAENYTGTETGKGFEGVIPIGTAIQNARSSYMALQQYVNPDSPEPERVYFESDPVMGLQRDGAHVTYSVGRYIAALTFCRTVVPEEMTVGDPTEIEIRRSPGSPAHPDEYKQLAMAAVNAAMETAEYEGDNRFVRTKLSDFLTDPTDSLIGLLQAEKVSAEWSEDSGVTLEEAARAAIASRLPEIARLTVSSVEKNGEGDLWTVGASLLYGYTEREFELTVVVTEPEAHEHEYTAEVTGPTCTEGGYTTYTCECGDSYVDDYTDPLGHGWDDGVIKTPASVLYEGTMLFTCLRCGETREEVIPKRDEVPKDKRLRILFIGNSYSEDLTDGFTYPDGTSYTGYSTVYEMLRTVTGGEIEIEIGLLMSGGKSLTWHSYVANNGLDYYAFRVVGDSTRGRWVELSQNATTVDGLNFYNWDMVVLQPYGNEVKKGESSTPNAQMKPFAKLEDSVPFMLDFVETHNPGAEIWLYLPIANIKKAEMNGGESDLGKTAFWVETASFMSGKETHKQFSGVIPIGTAIQNARSTYMAVQQYVYPGAPDPAVVNFDSDPIMGLQRDELHVSYSVGRYIDALTFCKTAVPLDMRKPGAEPETVAIRRPEGAPALPEEYKELARAASDAAAESVDNKFAWIRMTGFEIDPTDTLIEKLAAADLEAFCPDPSGADSEDAVYNAIAAALPDNAVLTVDSLTVDGAAASVAVTVLYGYTARTAEVTVTLLDHEHEYELATSDYAHDGRDSYTEIYVCSICGKEDERVTEKIPCPGVGFTDMPKYGNWAHEGLDFCLENGLIAGMSKDTVAPAGVMTRAMLVTVLWRAEGKPEAQGKTPFTDVKAKWAKDAVAWAYENEIVKGMTATTFAPDDKLSREQIATILYRFTEYKGGDVSARADLSGFPDGGKTHSYAKDAMSWAVAEGLISGVKQGNMNYLDPRGNATRAQVATILMRYLEG